MLSYLDDLAWEPSANGDRAIVSEDGSAEAFIQPSKNASKYRNELKAGRFVARIRPIRGTYPRLGMVDGDLGYIYLWVRAANDSVRPDTASLIFASPHAAIGMRVDPRPRASGPHASRTRDSSYASWTDAPPPRTGAAPGAPPRQVGAAADAPRGIRLASIIPIPRLAMATQSRDLVPWADCSQYCCVVD